MKLRKSKSDKSFLITFFTRKTVVVANKGNVGGWEKRDQVISDPQTVRAVGHSRESVLRGFLFGRDRNNIVVTGVGLERA